MGLTYVIGQIVNPQKHGARAAVRFLVDSGALFSVIPKDTLKALGVKPMGAETVILADGSRAKWPVGEVVIQINGRRRTTQVLFGKKGTLPLLGVLSLEALGYSLDPRTRKLTPTPLIIA